MTYYINLQLHVKAYLPYLFIPFFEKLIHTYSYYFGRIIHFLCESTDLTNHCKLFYSFAIIGRVMIFSSRDTTNEI